MSSPQLPTETFAMVQEAGVFFGKHRVRADVSSATHSSSCLSSVGGRPKQLFDIIFSFALLVILSPMFILTAVAIKFCDNGPLLFSHRRIGLSLRPFQCLKFRTMAVDADKKLAAHLAANEQAAVEWATKRKLKADPRLTPIGAALRRSSLDELPQLINVLCGEMSLVGPRPIVAEELVHYGADAALCMSVRPGLTGAWQVSGRSDTSYEARVQMDKDYCLNWSMSGDLVIILKTIPAVIFARGAC
jgi:exopolysaccharide production protein ExoY